MSGLPSPQKRAAESGRRRCSESPTRVRTARDRFLPPLTGRKARRRAVSCESTRRLRAGYPEPVDSLHCSSSRGPRWAALPAGSGRLGAPASIPPPSGLTVRFTSPSAVSPSRSRTTPLTLHVATLRRRGQGNATRLAASDRKVCYHPDHQTPEPCRSRRSPRLAYGRLLLKA